MSIISIASEIRSTLSGPWFSTVASYLFHVKGNRLCRLTNRHAYLWVRTFSGPLGDNKTFKMSTAPTKSHQRQAAKLTAFQTLNSFEGFFEKILNLILKLMNIVYQVIVIKPLTRTPPPPPPKRISEGDILKIINQNFGLLLEQFQFQFRIPI